MLIILAVFEVRFRASALLRHKSNRLLRHILVIRHFNPRTALIVQKKLTVDQLVVKNDPAPSSIYLVFFVIFVLMRSHLSTIVTMSFDIINIIDIFESGSFTPWHIKMAFAVTECSVDQACVDYLCLASLEHSGHWLTHMMVC